MNCPKFEILRGTKKLGHFYASQSGDLSTFEKLRICQALNLTFEEDLAFLPTSITVDVRKLPSTPTFKTFKSSGAGRLWVYPIDKPLPF